VRRGTFTLVVLRQQAAGGGVLRSGRLGPPSPALSSNGHRRKRWSDQGVARKRRHDRAVAFGVSLCGALAATYGRSRRDLAARSIRDPSSTGEGHRVPKGLVSTRADSALLRERSARMKRRESDARECVRASEVQLQKSLGGSLTQRSACRRFA